MKKSRGILYWLRVILTFCCIVLLLFRCSSSLIAFAAGGSGGGDSSGLHSETTTSGGSSGSGGGGQDEDGVYLTLSPGQTLALYGTQINASIRTVRNQEVATSITFDYAFPLNSVGYMDSGGGFLYDDCFAAMSTSAGRETIAQYLSSSNGLVYVASSSQWGGTKPVAYPYSERNPQPVQLTVPFSISISNISGIRQSVLYPTISYSYNTEGTPFLQNNLGLLTSDNSYSFDSIKGKTFGGIDCPASFALPTYPFSASSATLDESSVQYMAGFYMDYVYPDDPLFSVEAMTIRAYMVTSSQQNSNDLWLVITCPTLYSYNPPVETSTVTFPTATFPTETFPLDTSTSYNPFQIINNNTNTQINQLNLIIGQLNLIYAQLVANGRLGLDLDLGWNPDLQDGETPSFYGTDVHSEMQAIVSGHTTATVPEMNTRFVHEAFSYIWDEIPFAAVLGGLSLVLSTASWIIFKGRGG